ncbi:MAG: SAM-dependent DNA methyltransferase [Chitinispirillaceae bacterium]|nr:SAM-dependent DNA methyltransferase [Chitinispirillaceae bacterium]
MLTVAEETLNKLAVKRGKQVTTHLYGQEINPETYAICKADMILKGEYEPDSELRDSEQVPLLETGGIEAFFRREVLPYTPDAWIKEGSTKIGYEISFTRHFYKPQPMRSLADIHAEIASVQKEAEGLLDGLLKTHNG